MKRTLSQTDLSVPNFVTFTIRGIPNAAYQLGQTFSEITMQIRATVWSTDIVDDINYSVAQQVWNLQGLWLCKRVFKLMQNNRHELTLVCPYFDIVTFWHWKAQEILEKNRLKEIEKTQALDAQQLADWEKPVDALAEEHGMYLLDLLWGATLFSFVGFPALSNVFKTPETQVLVIVKAVKNLRIALKKLQLDRLPAEAQPKVTSLVVYIYCLVQEAWNSYGILAGKKGLLDGKCSARRSESRMKGIYGVFAMAKAQLLGTDHQRRKLQEEQFDEYAEEFEDHLVNTLEYHLPEVIASKMASFGSIRADREVDRRRPVSLLSASRYRVLSGGRAGLPRGFEAGMLAHAREAGGYDELLQRDLISVLRSQEAASVDLLVAADVLIYVLQLDKVFLQAHRVLRKDGIFVFSTETACEAESSEEDDLPLQGDVFVLQRLPPEVGSSGDVDRCIKLFQELLISLGFRSNAQGLFRQWKEVQASLGKEEGATEDGEKGKDGKDKKGKEKDDKKEDPFDSFEVKKEVELCWSGVGSDEYAFQLLRCVLGLMYMGPQMTRLVGTAKDPKERVNFKPDKWQRDLLDIVDDNESALVTRVQLVVAPTASGKTFIGYYVMDQAGGVAEAGKWKQCQVLVTIPHILEMLLLSAENQDWVARLRYVVFDEDLYKYVWVGGELRPLHPFCCFVESSLRRNGMSSDLRWCNYTKRICKAEVQRIIGVNDKWDRFVTKIDARGYERELKETFLQLLRDDVGLAWLLHSVMALGNEVDLTKLVKETSYLQAATLFKLCKDLDQKDIMPAIIFNFSRKEIERMLKKLVEELEYWGDEEAKIRTRKINDKSGPPNTQVALVVGEVEYRLPRLYAFFGTAEVDAFSPLENVPQTLGTGAKVGLHLMFSLVASPPQPRKCFWATPDSDCPAMGTLETADLLERRKADYEQKKAAFEEAQKMRASAKQEGTAVEEEKLKLWTYHRTKGFSGPDAKDLMLQEPKEPKDISEEIDPEDIDELINDAKTKGGAANWMVEGLRRGIGIHHEGMRFFSVVGSILSAEYLRVVFATGTLALGINMPCRSTIFCGDSLDWFAQLLVQA
ncbi:putative ATP-dependent RNA helicase DDX60 [Symbiodinium microadriaticum]|uniref:Putative ATP-dependent RNA helicase DDX60 n=1 Tax=Symbiodinium microadriaticum TaxID=2951 RepID=A0A1Q9CQ44_SYMMI|nr:putative ATP-dependent RNA helicase DDX60 [Symbiodinium microadriaticum]